MEKTLTFKELGDEWLLQNHSGQIKERTFLRYRQIIDNNINPYLGEKIISDLNAREMQLFVNEIREKPSAKTGKKLSARTANMILLVLKMILEYAVEFELIDKNPASKIKPLKEDKTQVCAFTREEQIRIERYIEEKNDDEYFYYLFVLYTGLRIGELCALEWKDINLREGLVSIYKTRYLTKDENGNWKAKEGTPKTKSSNRLIPIPSFLLERLKRMKKERKSNYFCAKKDGSRLDQRLLVWRFLAMLKHLRIRRMTFHSLRHTFATRALEAKMDIKTLSEMLGHSSCATTLDIYTYSLLEHKKKVMRNFKQIR